MVVSIAGRFSYTRKHVTTHSLRRTFATLSLRTGMDVLQLQALMGHSSLETTRHYVRLLDEDLKRTHKAHGPVGIMLGNFVFFLYFP
jgi:site-specific recombinase XerD